MADLHREPSSLEEQLQQDKRLAAAHRRRRRMRWSIPLGILLLLILAGITYLVVRAIRRPDAAEDDTPPVVDASVTIAFVGDISMDEEALNFFRAGTGYDFSPCFRHVTAELTGCDLAVGNLEGNITDSDSVGSYQYPPALLDALYQAGFDILQTANSYSIQNGITGLVRTKQAVEAAGMATVGTCASQAEWDETGGVLIRDVNGIRFAFIAFTKSMNNLRLPEGAEYSVNLLYDDYDTNYKTIAKTDILNVINRAKARQPDVIIALVHWGSEYTEEISDSQRQIANLLQENGVTLIIGSHSHYVGPIEQVNAPEFAGGKGLVAYGLGDFLSAADTTTARNGCILRVCFEKHGNQVQLASVSYSPTYSVMPSERLETDSYEILDSLQAVSLYRQNYYDSISAPLYEMLVSAISRMGEQTGAPELQSKK